MNKEYSCIKEGLVVDTIMLDDPTQELINIFKQSLEVDDIVPSTEDSRIGFSWDGQKFWPPKPYLSWIKNEEHHHWEPPVEYPDNDDFITLPDGTEVPRTYVWNEDILNWQEIQALE